MSEKYLKKRRFKKAHRGSPRRPGYELQNPMLETSKWLVRRLEMQLRILARFACAIPILGGLCVAPARAQNDLDVVTFKCTFAHAPVDPHTITIDFSKGTVTETYPDPNAPAHFTLFNGRPDNHGDVLHLTVTATTIDIDISNPDPAKVVDDRTEQINRATGLTTESSQNFVVGTGQCTRIQ